MIINGKEVLYSFKDTLNIQQEINRLDTPNTELKSEITKEELNDLKKRGITLDSVEVNNFNVGFDKNNNDTGYDNLNDRKQRYTIFEEMDKMEFIHRALEIVADDATQQNSDGNRVEIISDDYKIKELLQSLFYERLDLENELWSILFETSKKGDMFFEVVVDNYQQPKHIVALKYLKPENIERIESNGRLLYFTYKDEKIDKETNKKTEEIEYRLQPWQILHFKVDSKINAPYGASLLEAGIKTFRRLSLLEDVMLVYRIARSPERRVFYVDVGNLNNIEARKFLTQFKNNYRTQNVIDENGRINKRANVLSITSDIFVPVREGSTGTRIETLPGGNAMQGLDDLNYFRDKILRLMNIPPAYLGDQSDKSRGGLAQQDIKFSRFIERMQNQVIKTLNKLATLELFFNRYKKTDLNNFRIEFTPPSNIKEIVDLEFLNQKIQLLTSIQATNLFANSWILKKVLQLSDKEIADIQLYKTLQDNNINPAMQQQATNMGYSLPPTTGGEMMPPETPTGEIPPEGTEIPPTENTGEVPPEGTEVPPEEAAPAINASAFVNVLGKKFLIENQKDFFKMLKLLENIKQTDNVKKARNILNEIYDIVQKNKVRIKNNKTGEIAKLRIINEFGGLQLDEGKIRLFKKDNLNEEVEYNL